MSAQTPADAITFHREQAQRCVSCVTNAVITITRLRGYQQQALTLIYRVVLASGQPVRVQGVVPLSLRIAQQFEVRRPAALSRSWIVEVTEYWYTLQLPNGREIVAYHWHPDSLSANTEPHLHLGPAATRLDSAVRPRELHKVHFPTGCVSLEQVIRLAITEFGVEPRRADWDTILSGQSA